MGIESAAALWNGSAAAASAPHTRPAASLVATEQLWREMYPAEPFHLPDLCADYTNGVACAQVGQISGSPLIKATADDQKDVRLSRPCTPEDWPKSVLQYKLVTACIRQFDFWHSVRLILPMFTLYCCSESVSSDHVLFVFDCA